MRVEFVKMHGLGNDFVVLDGRERALPALRPDFVRALADRRTGIGCDQLIALAPSDRVDARMQIFNADGGEVEACGNASRAVGLLLNAAARIETLGGDLAVRPDGADIAVDMGEPRFDWQAIPLACAMDTLTMPVGWDELTAPTAVNVGNPHVVFFVKNPATIPLDRLGPAIECDPLFPDRVNVNIAALLSRSRIALRVWERGVGETRACGTGACATAIGAMRRGLADRSVTIAMPGGDLAVTWGADNRITMTGPAAESFRGSFESADFGG